MKSKRSWNWLAPRNNGQRTRNADAARKVNSRPCLAVERLEDRNLLAVASSEVIGEPPPLTGDAAVVSDLLSGGIKVTTDELQLIKYLATATPAENKQHVSDLHFTSTVNKASPKLMQMNDTVVKIGEDIIRGQLTDKKVMAAEAKIEYLKIKLEDIIITSVATSDQQAGAAMVNSLVGDAETVLNELITHRKAGKGQQEFFKIASDVQKMEEVAIRGELQTIKAGSPGNLDDFTNKIEALYQNASQEIIKLKLDEGTTQQLQTALDDFNTSLLGNLSGGGNFGGGIGQPSTDDTIS
jgi:type VI protein secretion system component Hcp